MAIASATDQTASSANDVLGTACSTGTTDTTAQACELILGGLGNGYYTTINYSGETNGFTVGLTSNNLISRYKIVNATGTYGFEATLDQSTNYAGIMATFKGA